MRIFKGFKVRILRIQAFFLLYYIVIFFGLRYLQHSTPMPQTLILDCTMGWVIQERVLHGVEPPGTSTHRKTRNPGGSTPLGSTNLTPVEKFNIPEYQVSKELNLSLIFPSFLVLHCCELVPNH